MSRILSEYVHRVRQIVDQLHIREADASPEDTTTRQYGFMKFSQDEIDENTRCAEYIHLALKTKAETVVAFMQEAWRLRTPDLIISISGGAKYCDLSARLRKTLHIGLVTAAATTNAWIITAGTDAGVVREVGQAINKYRYKSQKDGVDIPCIGIASWGYTAGKDQLDHSTSLLASSPSGDGNSSNNKLVQVALDALRMREEVVHGIHSYVNRGKEEKRCHLEPNHTHFLLLDDGTALPENVLALRADIEMYSRRTNIEKSIEGAAPTLIPIVMIVVEGGRSTVQTLCEALNSNTPVVVVKDSGRAADLVADLHAFFSRGSIDNTNQSFELEDSKSPVQSNFAAAGRRLASLNVIFAKARAQNPWVDAVREEVCRVVKEHKQLVTIFNFDSPRHHGRLEEAILEAVFDAAKLSNASNEQYRSAAELRLALAWRNVDYARRLIFTESTISRWRPEDLRQGLVDALRRGYIDFIELFIEYGVTLDMLTAGDIEYLYTTASIDKTLPLRNIGTNEVTRDQFYEVYMKNRLAKYNDRTVILGEHAVRDLYLWAIFLDRFDFAVYLCSKTWDQSTALLYGARIYQKAAAITADSETQRHYQNNAGILDKYAASVIDLCFENDRDFAVNILRRPAPAFYDVQPLPLALKANCQRYLASKCVQRYLDNEWYGNINYKRQNIGFRIFFCTIFLPLIPFFYGSLPYIHRHQRDALNASANAKNIASVSQRIPSRERHISWSQKLQYFYRAPVVRFYYNLIFFFVFLALFSFVLLVDYFPLNTHYDRRSGIKNLPLPITEMCLHVCIWGIIFEEIRQVASMHSYGEYLGDLSNLIDLTAIVLYLLGFIMRFIVDETFFTISKILFGLDLILWYIRILHLFAAHERLGPKLIMIFNTMKDLVFFVCFILVFLLGFSITSWSFIISPTQVKWMYDSQGQLEDVTISDDPAHTWSWKLLRDMTNYGVWKVFGQVDIVDGNNLYSAVVFILAIFFVAVSNVLLLNVLVALFNVTIQNVHIQSHELWRYQRFLLVSEYRQRSLLPPPFNVFSWCIGMLSTAIQRRRSRYRDHQPVSSEDLTDVDVHETARDGPEQPLKITDTMKRESAIAEDFWRDTLKETEEKTK